MSGWIWVRIGAILGLLGVGLGAFGAHGLKEKLQTLGTTATFHTATEYHLYHALALLAVGLLAQAGRPGSALSAVAGWSFLVGILLFSGSLYALAVTGYTKLGAITPFGGILFLVGWIALAVAAGGGPHP
jgi:uncharacterized membrane protein YgdD (TMEM256/DUF423 family)